MFGIDDAFNFASSALGYFSQQDTNDSNRDIARDTNQFNKQMSQDQMNFQERMSNTAYQRAKVDMQKAGLNPVLAYSQGGSSSPAGSAISGTTGAPMQNPASSAIDALRVRAELKNLFETNKKIKSDTALNNALRISAGSSARKTLADAKLSESSVNKADTFSKLWSLPNKVLSWGSSHVPTSAKSFKKTLSDFEVSVHNRANRR